MATLTILLACILYIFLFSELWLNYYLCCTKKSPLKIKKRGAFGTPYAPLFATEPKFSIALLQWSVLLDKLESPKGVIITSDRVLAKPLGADNDDAETAIAEAALEHVSTYNLVRAVNDVSPLCETFRLPFNCVPTFFDSFCCFWHNAFLLALQGVVIFKYCHTMIISNIHMNCKFAWKEYFRLYPFLYVLLLSLTLLENLNLSLFSSSFVLLCNGY